MLSLYQIDYSIHNRYAQNRAVLDNPYNISYEMYYIESRLC